MILQYSAVAVALAGAIYLACTSYSDDPHQGWPMTLASAIAGALMFLVVYAVVLMIVGPDLVEAITNYNTYMEAVNHAAAH